MRTLKSIAPFASFTWFLIQMVRNKDLIDGLHVDWESIYIAGAVVSALFIVVLYARVAKNALLAIVPSYKFKGMHRRIERCRRRVELNIGHIQRIDECQSQFLTRIRLFDDLENLRIKIPDLDSDSETVLQFLAMMSLASERGELADAREFAESGYESDC